MIVLTRRAALQGALAGTMTILAAPQVRAGGHGRIGTFTGAERYGAGGRVEVVGNEIILMDDFTFNGAPDPKIAMGRDGYDPATLSGLLRSNTGRQSYTLPDGLDGGDYNEVWIWCERFDVPLAVARLD